MEDSTEQKQGSPLSPITEQEEDRIVEPSDALPQVTMADISEQLRNAASGAGWSKLMPVQAMAIPYMLAGRDLMVQSRTGSGKTGAFVLPLLEKIDPELAAPQALILVPTRELARQVANEAELLVRATSIRSVAVYGGVGYGAQKAALEKGAHIVVGTPGRILDHLMQRTLRLDKLRVLVFDEADRMMSMGFYPDMKKVQSYLPRKTLSGYMFSATFPHYVVRLASEFLNRPEMLSLSRDRVHVAETTHVYYEVPPMEKDRCLVRIIEMENPTSAIIFCNTKVQVHYVNIVLQRFGYNADELSADLSQTAREQVMKRIRAGALRLLIATDLAARGIDIPELSHVIQYDIPEDHEAYIHRSGRTSRAGSVGVAISLVAGTERISLVHIAKLYDIELLERPVPSPVDVQNLVSERVTALLESALRERDTLQTERMEALIPVARAFGVRDDQLPLIAALIDDYYQTASAVNPELSDEQTPDSDTITVLLKSKLLGRDNLQTERMERFTPLAKELGVHEKQLPLIAMLLDDYYQTSLGAVPFEPMTSINTKRHIVKEKSDSSYKGKRPPGRNSGSRSGGKGRKPRR